MMMMFLAAFSVFVAVTAGVLAVTTARTATATATQARLERISGRFDYGPAADSSTMLRGSRLSSMDWAERLLAELDFARGLQSTMMRADWNMSVSEFLSICGVGGAILFLIGQLVLGQFLIGIVLAPLGMALPMLFLRHAAAKRIKTIEKALAEWLVMMSNSLKGGFGLMQAVDQTARQLEGPLADELRRLIRDTQVGSSVEEAIVEFGRRIGGYDLDIVVTAVLVQRNVGGNLSEILDKVAHTMRERDRIKGEIATLTSQQKLTGFVIGGLPVGLAILFTVLNGEYMSMLWTERLGHILIGASVTFEVIGALVIRKIVNIDV